MPPTSLLTVDATDNGGRRRTQDRRFLVSAPCARERRANWERRSGYDRRFRRIQEVEGQKMNVQRPMKGQDSRG